MIDPLGATVTIAKRGARGSGDASGECLLLALEAARPLAPPTAFALAGVHEVAIGRGPERRGQSDGKRLRIDVADEWMSADHARLMRGRQGWRVADLGSKNGTFVNGLGAQDVEVSGDDVVEAGGTIFLLRDAVAAGPLDPRPAFRTLMPGLAEQLRTLERVARVPVPVLLAGESGTGKEILARAIHAMSERSGPFVAVNCGALPAALVEGELFGARRGAFSGAMSDRAGLIAAAHEGTLFLDEIAELPATGQTALLRALQEGEVRQLGATKTTNVDFRVIAATHQDLGARVADGSFRRDLYARLRGYRFTLPPVRERREDVALLVASLLARLAPDRAADLRFAPDAARALFLYPWPLNVRELEHALRTACAVVAGDKIELADLPEELCAAPAAPISDRARFLDLARVHAANISAMAKALGTSRAQVRRLAQRYGVDLRGLRDEV